MRVTHQLVKNTVLRNIQRNLRNMDRLQDMLSSGKTVSKPSDDPIKVARVMGYNTTLAQNEQYQRNINAAASWVETAEYALQGVNEVLQKARELALSGGNGTLSQSALDAIAMEVDELAGVLVQLGNSNYEGRYIFAGFKTTTIPFQRDKALLATEDTSVTYHGDQGAITWEVAPNVTVKGNLDGKDLFMDSRIFEYMDQLVLALKNGDETAIGSSATKLNNAIDHVLDKRAALGAIVNGLELTLDKYSAESLNFTKLRSELEDIDFAETMMNFSVMENVYRASIATGARVIQPSLLDFLR